MAYNIKDRVDITDLVKDLKRLRGKEWPKAIASMFRHISDDARESIDQRTRQVFNLHTEYIPRGIRNVPANPNQESRAARSLERYGDMFAAVYLRGAADPKRSLEFMTHHETGRTRDAQSKWVSLGSQEYIAVPGSAYKGGKHRTRSGRVKKRNSPAALLAKFRQSGSRYEHGTTKTNKFPTRKRTRLPGSPFIIKGKSGDPMIVRRASKRSGDSAGKLETLYVLKKKANIREGWRFEHTVMSSAKKNYKRRAVQSSNRLAARF